MTGTPPRRHVCFSFHIFLNLFHFSLLFLFPALLDIYFLYILHRFSLLSPQVPHLSLSPCRAVSSILFSRRDCNSAVNVVSLYFTRSDFSFSQHSFRTNHFSNLLCGPRQSRGRQPVPPLCLFCFPWCGGESFKLCRNNTHLDSFSSGIAREEVAGGIPSVHNERQRTIPSRFCFTINP